MSGGYWFLVLGESYCNRIDIRARESASGSRGAGMGALAIDPNKQYPEITSLSADESVP